MTPQADVDVLLEGFRDPDAKLEGSKVRAELSRSLVYMPLVHV